MNFKVSFTLIIGFILFTKTDAGANHFGERFDFPDTR